VTNKRFINCEFVINSSKMIIKIDEKPVSSAELHEMKASGTFYTKSPLVEILVTSKDRDGVYWPFRDNAARLSCLTKYDNSRSLREKISGFFSWLGHGPVVRTEAKSIGDFEDELLNYGIGKLSLIKIYQSIVDANWDVRGDKPHILERNVKKTKTDAKSKWDAQVREVIGHFIDFGSFRLDKNSELYVVERDRGLLTSGRAKRLITARLTLNEYMGRPSKPGFNDEWDKRIVYSLSA